MFVLIIILLDFCHFVFFIQTCQNLGQSQKQWLAEDLCTHGKKKFGLGLKSYLVKEEQLVSKGALQEKSEPFVTFSGL